MLKTRNIARIKFGKNYFEIYVKCKIETLVKRDTKKLYVKAKKNIIKNLIRLAPLIILFISVLNEFDLNYLEIFSLNFPFILIFYWSLRKTELLGYGFIFLAGLINDVVTGFPIGISSFNYLLICGFAAYLRTITLRPSMVKDWFFFLFSILLVNSLSLIHI